MTVDLDGSWRMQVSLSMCGAIMNSRMRGHDALWDNCNMYCILAMCAGEFTHVWFCFHASGFLVMRESR